ncbi:MAG: hypothetical protein AMXMBFR47_38250 [Planctomycetota bacterium]
MKKLLTIGFCFAASSAALAGFTAIGSSGETNTKRILEEITGVGAGGLSGAAWGDVSYTGGGFTVTRVDDFLSPNGVLDLSTGFAGGSAADQLWRDGTVMVGAQARFAGFSQRFGWDAGVSGGSYVNLFDVSGSGFAVSGGGNFSLSANPFVFARNGTNGPQWSDQSRNVALRDQMITYEITSTSGGPKRWVLMFEDKNFGDSGADWDYNDLVVELTIIPVPGAALLAVLGLGIAGWAKRRTA